MGHESLDHLLERCLQEMERTDDIDAVLRRFPEHADELRPLIQLAATMRAPYAGVPEPTAELEVGRARLSRAAEKAREAAAGKRVPARTEEERRSTVRPRLRLVPTLVGVALALMIGMASVAGVARAVYDAAPGDVLYGPKRALEEVQLRLTLDAEARAELRNELAERRMQEVQTLIQKRDQAHLQDALGEYGDAVGALVGEPEDREMLGDPARVAEMSGTLARHEEQLGFAFQRTASEEEVTDDDDDDDTDKWWTEGITHPVASTISTTYQIDYEQIVSWFVDGEYGFGEIMLALRTAEMLDEEMDCYVTDDLAAAAECLLTLKTDLGGWGEVWLALGIIGAPEEPGPPNHAGPPDGVGPDEADGPPDEAGPPGDEDPPEGGEPPADEPDDDGPPDGLPVPPEVPPVEVPAPGGRRP